jgi:uracil-DNA glycosylase
MNKLKKISLVFDDIFNLNVSGEDFAKVRRDISKTNLDATVMIVAEAMAPQQVRLSGVNYFFKDGTIGSTGKSLEKFLNKFNCTVYPNKLNCVYHTEIVHSFPGYEIINGKKMIRKPSKDEIKLSVGSGILSKEIEIIKPKLILLMGNTAYKTFYNYFLNLQCENNLSQEIVRISETQKCTSYKNIPVIPIQHSSGANPRFNKMVENKRLLHLIKKFVILSNTGVLDIDLHEI